MKPNMIGLAALMAAGFSLPQRPMPTGTALRNGKVIPRYTPEELAELQAIDAKIEANRKRLDGVRTAKARERMARRMEKRKMAQAVKESRGQSTKEPL